MKQFGGKHPKHEAEGAILWPRHQPYVVGDRVRGTVLLITETGVLEMIPEYAREFAKEMLVHADDVGGGVSAPSEPSK